MKLLPCCLVNMGRKTFDVRRRTRRACFSLNQRISWAIGGIAFHDNALLKDSEWWKKIWGLDIPS